MSKFNNATQFGKDWEQTVNFDRLRKYRLNRTQDAIKNKGLQALVLFRAEDFRYVCGIKGEQFSPNSLRRWTIVPADGKPWHWELGGDYGRVKENMSPFMPGRIQLSIPMQHAFLGSTSEKMKNYVVKEFIGNVKKVLKDNGLSVHGPIGVDLLSKMVIEGLQDADIDFVDAAPTLSEAKYIKSEDEIQLMRIACNISDASFYALEQMIRPGVRECELWAEVVKTALALGAENCIGILASGGRTNPYYRMEGTDRIIAPGDLVISDIITTYMGYNTCFVRTFMVGKKPSAEQKALYRECYESLYKAINMCKAGVMTDKIADAMPKQTWENYSLQVGHGIGTSLHEFPFIAEMWSKDNPLELKPNAVVAMETYAGKKGGTQGVRLEEDYVITEDGYEMLSKYPFDEKFLD